MAIARPIFRIFDYNKALEFYVGWLCFNIDWEHKEDNTPVYMQISLQGIVIHLTEHHGDCCPGARSHINDFENLKAYHKTLLAKDYKYNRPGLEPTFYDPHTLCMEVVDPFGNRLTFTGPS